MTGELRYLYAVANANADIAIAAADLRGIDGGRIEAIVEGRILGATSTVPAADYEEEPLNERLQDVNWLAPRAASHQEVNGKLLDLASAVIPVAFGAVYRGTDGVRELLRTSADDLADRLRAVEGRAEWIISIEREGSAALVGDRAERRARDAAVAEETWATIEAIAERVYREALIDDPTVAMIARFSVLAQRERKVELVDVVRRLGATATSDGYRTRLSGPWPTYRFGGLPTERVAAT